MLGFLNLDIPEAEKKALVLFIATGSQFGSGFFGFGRDRKRDTRGKGRHWHLGGGGISDLQITTSIFSLSPAEVCY